ncbi:MAG: hypothetical protein Alpg2KO_22320 [Alphaproteobacteria bacterium]
MGNPAEKQRVVRATAVEAAAMMADDATWDTAIELSQPLATGLRVSLWLMCVAVGLFLALWLFAPDKGTFGFAALLAQELALMVAVLSLIWGLISGLRAPVQAGLRISPTGICFDQTGAEVEWHQFDQLFIQDDRLIAQIEHDPQAAVICRLEAVAEAEAEYGRGQLFPDKPLERALLLAAADQHNPHLERLAVPLGDQFGGWAALLKEIQHRITTARAEMVASDPVQVQAIRAFIGMDAIRMKRWKDAKRRALTEAAPDPPANQVVLLYRMAASALLQDRTGTPGPLVGRQTAKRLKSSLEALVRSSDIHQPA